MPETLTPVFSAPESSPPMLPSPELNPLPPEAMLNNPELPDP
ncbi:hypothetical protein [Mycobacterium sp. Z3061]|nr:hypothetical protein [Mycobacterium sp. Z3061]